MKTKGERWLVKLGFCILLSAPGAQSPWLADFARRLPRGVISAETTGENESRSRFSCSTKRLFPTCNMHPFSPPRRDPFRGPRRRGRLPLRRGAPACGRRRRASRGPGRRPGIPRRPRVPPARALPRRGAVRVRRGRPEAGAPRGRARAGRGGAQPAPARVSAAGRGWLALPRRCD